MRLSGKIIHNTNILKEATAESNKDSVSFRDALEDCLVKVCRELDIPVPLWLNKNTREFIDFRRTTFNKEHFVETIKFDRFDIRIE